MMKKPASVKDLGRFGSVRLSKTFFMRDFLFSEISQITGISNVPDNPDLAITVGKRLCCDLLEPLQDRFGRIAIRSAYRTAEVNDYGNKNKLGCASNKKNNGRHIWDQLDSNGWMGATACVVVPWFAEQYEKGADWRGMAWWIHDHLPYSSLYFFPRRAAFNIRWCEIPDRRIDSYVMPKGKLTERGMPNWKGNHEAEYAWFGDGGY